MVWYSCFLKNFPQYIVIQIVKGFGIINKAEVDVFLELSCFFYDSTMLAIWFLVPLPFINPTCSSESSQFTYSWSLAWSVWSIILLAYEISKILQYSEPSLALPFFEIRMKIDLSQSCGYLWVFQICWHNECSTLTASCFRTWNSSAGIPSPTLALLVVMLPEAHLTSHSRMSGSSWVTTPL